MFTLFSYLEVLFVHVIWFSASENRALELPSGSEGGTDLSCLSLAAASASSSSTERWGILGALFVEDVQTYLTQSNLDVNSALSLLQERLQQYKLAEMKLLAQQRELQGKIPDIEKCLDVVATMQAKKDSGEELIADFEVSEDIYSRA
ncbi:hypothetical protein MLD38_038798 [Melastoma candidum]|uniref:Uncharacterized protein n=1 Tax=Melastoma candidum TaxID=119954 RepID=A0ACB9L0T2_9MYRT|nr:hypothetical protein MLD38_038798 [Melastoma candidum]